MKKYTGFLVKTLVAVTIPVVVFALIGCVPEEEVKDYGQKVAPEEVNEALSKAMGDLDFTQARVGEYAEREQWAEIIGSQGFLQRREGLEFISRTTTGDLHELEMLYSAHIYDNSGKLIDEKPPTQISFKACQGSCPPAESSAGTVESENSYQGSLASSTASSNLVFKPRSIKPDFSRLWAMATGKSEDAAPKAVRVTYHNLKVIEELVEPPPEVGKSADCRGLSPCKINATTVKYDSVYWENDKDVQVVQTQFTTSSELPFFSRYRVYLNEEGQIQMSFAPLSYCQTYAAQATPIRLCENLYDFLPGE